MKQHKEFLKTEWKKRTKDKDKISQRMLVTFPDRRRMVNEVKSIKDIRDEYPALFCESEVYNICICIFEAVLVLHCIDIIFIYLLD